MKTAVVVLTCLILPLGGHSGENPRPAFIPGVPPATKQVADYTPGDVFGALATRTTQLPSGHPILNTDDEIAKLRMEWPGAVQSPSVDALCQIILDAPASKREGGTLENFVFERAMDNLKYVLVEAIAVSDVEKADALIRVINAQTDPIKIKRAKRVATLMFDQLLDPRFLEFLNESLSDSTIAQVFRGEEGPGIKWTTRRIAFKQLVNALKSIGIAVDASVFGFDAEAARCEALRAWITAHWAEVTAKCAETRANPDREKPTVIPSPWDAP